MTHKPDPIPPGYHTLTPYICARDAGRMCDFITAAFGGEARERMHGPDGRVAHAEFRIGDSMLMIGQSREGVPATTGVFYLYVRDTQALFARALAAGAKKLHEPTLMFYGDLSAAVIDPDGNQWWIATHVEDLTPEELERRLAAQRR